MSQNYSYPTSSSVTITGTPNNAPIPSTSLLVAGENALGNQQVLQTDDFGNLLVSLAAEPLSPLNTSDAADGPVSPGAVASKSILMGIQFNTLLPTLTNGQQASLQADSSGRLILSPLASTSTITVVQPTGTNLHTVIDASALPSGASTSALQTQISAQLPTALGTHTIANSLAVNIASDQVVPVSATALPLPSGAATSANQTNATQKTQIVDGSGNVISSTTNWLDVNVLGSVLPTGGATSALQGTGNASLVTIATNTTNLQNTITTVGSATPTNLLQIGVKNGSGLQPIVQGSATSANSIPVVIASDQVAISNNLTKIGGTNIALGSTTSSASLPVVIASDQASVPVKASTGTLTDGSGSTSATPSTSTQIFASNASRKYLLIQNLDTVNSIYINFTSAASNGSGSYTIAPLGSIVQESTYVSTEAINVLATSASVKFTAKQG